jgi:hypothetical protein
MATSDPIADVAALDAACEHVLSRDDKPSKPLWHFTGPDALKNIIATRRLWASHYAYTNDTVEMRIGEAAVREVIDNLTADEADGLKRAVYLRLQERFEGQGLTDRADVFLVCLTEANANSLPHWSGYGNRGVGYAVQLAFKPPPEENPKADLAVFCIKVIYDREAFRKLVAAQLGRFAELYRSYKGSEDVKELISTWMLRECAALSPRLKHECFAHEEEWRLLFVPMQIGNAKLLEFRNGDLGLTPYVEVENVIEVEGVVIGPSRESEHVQRLSAVCMLLMKHGYDPKIARLSKIPFR